MCTYNHLITLHRNCSMTSKRFKFLNMISKPFIVYGCHHYYHLCSLISWQLHPYIPYVYLLDHWSFADLHACSHFHTLPQFSPLPFSPTTKSSGKLCSPAIHFLSSKSLDYFLKNNYLDYLKMILYNDNTCCLAHISCSIKAG